MTTRPAGEVRFGGSRRPEGSAFADRFAAAIAARNTSLTALRERLAREGHHVALSTLSYWRSGERRPEHPSSLDAVAEIEIALDLTPGYLLHALPPTRRPGPRLAATPFSELAELDAATSREVLEDFGLDRLPTSALTTSIHLTVDVDRSRNDWRATTRLGIRALVDDLQTYPIALAGVAVGDRAGLEWTRGAEVGRAVVVADTGVHAWELQLERPLRVNETTVLEYALILPKTRHDHIEYFVEHQVRELMIWVRFSRPVLPRTAELYETSSGRERRSPVDLTGISAVSLSTQSFGPGKAGVRWDWEPCADEPPEPAPEPGSLTFTDHRPCGGQT